MRRKGDVDCIMELDAERKIGEQRQWNWRTDI